MFNDGSYRLWSLIIASIFLILGLVNSKILTPLNILWFKFGILLGKIVSPLIMGVIFFFVVTPTAIIMRILKKYWLFPIIIVLVVFGGLIVLSQGSAVAPFIYTLF